MDLIEEIKPTLVGGLRELRLERSNKWICFVARILEEGESSGKFRKVQESSGYRPHNCGCNQPI